MNRKHALKLISALVAAAVLVMSFAVYPHALELPFQTYNYNYWEDIVYTPAAYQPDYTVSGLDLSFEGKKIGSFVTPQDMCVSSDGRIFLADTGNNRIVILSSDAKNVCGIIDSFENDGKNDTFNQPSGVAYSDKDQLYIADSQNHRIVVLDAEGSLVRMIENPRAEVLEEGFVFVPLKITVDYADRVYCVAQNMFEGIMVFETNGEFAGFFGTISVEITLWEKFWRRIATKEEREKSRLYIPTEFTGVDIDPDGFVYASNIDPAGVQGVRRLNPKGQDVIKKGSNGNLGGDLQISDTTDYAGPSQFTDVLYRENGIYSCLDRKRGRIFTYDHEGNLLYIFGGMGQANGNFHYPVAIENVGGDIIALDATKAEIIYFRETQYGRLINEAVSLRFGGDETLAVPLWQQVLLLDENNELANTGIGKAYLTSGDYKQAMKYLKLGMARSYYSVAFKRYRNEFLRHHANIIFTAACLGSALIYAYPKIKKMKKKGGGDA